MSLAGKAVRIWRSLNRALRKKQAKMAHLQKRSNGWKIDLWLCYKCGPYLTLRVTVNNKLGHSCTGIFSWQLHTILDRHDPASANFHMQFTLIADNKGITLLSHRILTHFTLRSGCSITLHWQQDPKIKSENREHFTYYSIIHCLFPCIKSMCQPWLVCKSIEFN